MFIDFLERETSIVASCMHPNQGWNLQPFGVWDDAPINSATQPGQVKTLYWVTATSLLLFHSCLLWSIEIKKHPCRLTVHFGPKEAWVY